MKVFYLLKEVIYIIKNFLNRDMDKTKFQWPQRVSACSIVIMKQLKPVLSYLKSLQGPPIHSKSTQWLVLHF